MPNCCAGEAKTVTKRKLLWVVLVFIHASIAIVNEANSNQANSNQANSNQASALIIMSELQGNSGIS